MNWNNNLVRWFLQATTFSINIWIVVTWNSASCSIFYHLFYHLQHAYVVNLTLRRVWPGHYNTGWCKKFEDNTDFLTFKLMVRADWRVVDFFPHSVQSFLQRYFTPVLFVFFFHLLLNRHENKIRSNKPQEGSQTLWNDFKNFFSSGFPLFDNSSPLFSPAGPVSAMV